MSQPTSRHLLLALACASALLLSAPSGALAATPSPGNTAEPGSLSTSTKPVASPSAHDATRPWVMQAAAQQTFQSAAPTGSPRQAAAPLTAAASGLNREVFAFVNYGNLANTGVGYTTWSYPLLSTIVYFGLTVDANTGAFVVNNAYNTWNSSTGSGFVSYAHTHGVKVVLGIIYQDTGPGMCTALNNWQGTVNASRSQLLGADGVNIDYEGANQTCPDGQSQQAKLTAFTQHMRAAGLGYLSIDTYASSAGDSGGFFNIASLSPYVDSFFVMDYAMESSNGPCAKCMAPTSPLTAGTGNVYPYNVVRSAREYSPWAAQTILGFPWYGVKGCVSSTAPNAQVTGGYGADPYVTITSYPTDPKIHNWSPSRDVYDTAGQEPWASFYSDYANCTREEYWDDATSLGHKYDTVLQYGLRGAGIFTLDYGGPSTELWDSLAAHFTNRPGGVASTAVCGGQSQLSVSWRPPPLPNGTVTGFAVSVVANGSTVASQNVSAATTMAVFTGLTPGTSYSVTVQASNANGPGVLTYAGTAAPVANAPVQTSWFTWYDRASPGMLADNIHLVDPDATTASSGCASISGVAVAPFSVGAAGGAIVTFPQGVIGGPVLITVNTGHPVLASQRVATAGSLNEVPATSSGATDLYFSWFDRESSPGFTADNIHVVNPSSSPANVSVTIPGCAVQSATLAAGAEQVFSCAGGFGGPVRILSTNGVPVLASQRVTYYGTFNEVLATAVGAAATTSYFSWFDRISSPGFLNDNVHVVNPATSSGPAAISVAIPGCPAQTASVAPGGYSMFTCARGFGGPVVVSSTNGVPVIASQRVQYYQSFNEVVAQADAAKSASLWMPWFDRISSPAFHADNVHLVNPTSNAAPASATVSIPGCGPQTVTVAAGGYAIVTCAGGIGGPVHITSSVPILASQRVQYASSFNETVAQGG